MASRPDDLRRKVSSTAYASLNAASPGLPRTPVQRTTSYGFYDSPGSQLRPNSDCFVFEIGSRYLCAGIAGEPAPRGVIAFGPQQSRRVGDYRAWLPGYENSRIVKEIKDDFGDEYELWKMDVRSLDFRLLENKISRALWDMYTKYLLADTFQPTRKFVLAVPSSLPHPHLSLLLTTIFHMFQPASITLLPSAMLSIVAAGLRSGLVVDVGWSETVVTVIYDYCQVAQTRSVRGMKMLLRLFAQMLNVERTRQLGTPGDDAHSHRACDDISIDETEDVLVRLAWCSEKLNAEPESDVSHDRKEGSSSTDDRIQSIPLSSCKPPMTLELPFLRFSEPVDKTFFPPSTKSYELDDHNQTLHMLGYRALLSLSPDVRGVCMSRIVVTGGGSNIPGLKRRLFAELQSMIQTRGWDKVRSYGSAGNPRRQNVFHTPPRGGSPELSASSERSFETTRTSNEFVPAHAAEQEPDEIGDKIRQASLKTEKPIVTGIVRGVETLGAYAGASLVAGLRIRGMVEIERERFMQHGLAGASRDKRQSFGTSRQSLGSDLRTDVGERSSWSLGVFA